jgi:hypothetical protein
MRSGINLPYTGDIRAHISHNVLMGSRNRLIGLASCLLFAACSESTPVVPFEPQLLAPAGEIPSTAPRLSGDGRELVLSWLEPAEFGTTLNYARYEDGAWSEASTVVTIAQMFVNWADLPSVVPLSENRLAAHWLQETDDLPHAYDAITMQSDDNGATWSEPLRLHTDGTPTQHGFVTAFDDGSGSGYIWLDGRKMMNEVTDDPVGSSMTLRAAVVGENGTLRNEQLVDELVCDCCQTDVAVAASGPVAVYRDRTIDEIRDIFVTRLVEGKWLAGEMVAEDGWRISGCPVNGPSIDADGDNVVVAWFTGANGRPVVKLSFSDDGGETFGTPFEVVDGTVLGRVGVVLLDNGDVAVSWLQVSDGGVGEVHLRQIQSDGRRGPDQTVSYGAGSFSVPQLARFGDDLIVVWTESEDYVDQVFSVRIPVASLLAGPG